MTNRKEYELQEIMLENKFLDSRRKLGPDWREEVESLNPETALDRIDWLLSGSYGSEPYHWIRNQKRLMVDDKTTPKATANAWSRVGREAVMLIMLHDSNDLNMRKITQVLKDRSVDFAALNAKAGAACREFFEEEQREAEEWGE